MSVTDLRNGVHLSLSALAGEFGCARETVRNRLKDTGIQPSGKRGGHPVYRLRDVIGAFAQSEDFDPDKLKPLDRHTHYKAEREKLHLQAERGDLVPSIEVEQKFAGMFKVLTQGLETLPDVLERDVGANALQLVRIERVVDELRENLYQLITEDDDADGAAEIGA